MPLNVTGRKRTATPEDAEREVDLMGSMALQAKDNESDGESDSTDSEESEYSGLEEEEDSEDAMSESNEGASGSDDGESSSADESASDDDSDSGGGVNQDDNKTAILSKGKATPKTRGKRSLKGAKDTKQQTKLEKALSKSQPGSATTAEKSEPQVIVPDEYEYDSSDEEDLRNTVGNIPMEWYKEYKHIGYNLLGQKIIKPQAGDELDEFLSKMDDPNYWRTVKDHQTGQKVVLSTADIQLIKRFRRGKNVDASQDPYQPWIDFFTHEPMLHPLTNHPATKRSFIPSLLEKEKVGKMLHSIKMGWMKPTEEKKEESEEDKNFYSLWSKDENEISRRLAHHIPAPKIQLPGHAESYNPPPEYIPTEEEILAWNEQEPEDRKLNFVPKKFSSLRQVPAYDRFINERFERCLDLYLCPRQRKMRMNVNPEDLIPKLPKPKDLQPFPTTQAMIYRGHENIVRSISVSPTGQWVVSGSDDETVKVWEVSTGRCMRTIPMSGPVKRVAWNPSNSLAIVAAVVDTDIILVNPQVGDCLLLSNTDNLISSFKDSDATSTSTAVAAKWTTCEGKEWDAGFRVRISHPKAMGQISWHNRGDYLSAVMPASDSQSVFIHQISKRRSQNPFRKSKGLVQAVVFHPMRHFLFVATQRYVRVYNLMKLELMKKLATNVQWVSSIAVHPGGDNIILGSYDVKLAWFDLDLSTKPYQMLRHHRKAIRQVCYHRKYPLFASASDDGTIIVCHGTVYNDLLQNPLIVPVKVLRGHEERNNIGVLDCQFHPTQPWIFSSGADHTVRLYT